MLVQEEFFAAKQGASSKIPQLATSHTKTQQLLASSTSSWAQDIIAEREDRL
jgi:hypothetical protein